MIRKPPRVQVRQTAGIWAFEAALGRRGFGPVAGVDEAGRGACAGPLVVASCVLKPGDAAKLDGLTDSKLLTSVARDRMYDLVLKRALDYAVIVIPTAEVDLIGVHVANIEGMRRAVAQLGAHPGYVLTDGFPVPGLTAPNMPVVKGDRVAACVAAASVLAKVTRDRIMTGLHEEFPVYGFDVHKGYSTPEHTAALTEHGPSAQHRWSYANVAAAARRHGLEPPHRVARDVVATAVVQNGTTPQTSGGRLATRRGADSMITRAEA
ncbi:MULTISPECIES: ribonuclease HII [Saccharothrix]|uniref:ribonuclease HII n=1 Tax=Saccharothrix TaxID=2071 RepID=UPI00093A386F|nr:ribonuclease HII [Saccharothrix sp. CB00851]OKI20545.1 ribonuclease HII [Saccharothrix sp. CB00851]